jgi:predicted RNA-binding protein with EMAP domain
MIERCKSRCRSSFKAGARAAVAYLSAQNLFKGQSKGFFKVVTALAKAADGVG